MLHRAILGSLERFIGILIEQYAGACRPGWRRPRPWFSISPITRPSMRAGLKNSLMQQGFRMADLRNEKIGFKIREHTYSASPTCWS
jgi:threonyl-tRNA synthetase